MVRVHKLWYSIRAYRQGKTYRLLHDNSFMHTGAIRECYIQELQHPPYSLKTAPNNYVLF